MKKDYVILIVSLALILISGGVIYVIKAPEIEHRVEMPPQAADTNADLNSRIAHLEADLASRPNNLSILIDLGNAYYDIDNPPKAIEYYEKALAIQPKNPPVLVDCGVMYREAGDVDKSLEMFDRAIKADPEFPQAYFNKGAVLRMERGDTKGAAAAWKKYLELDSNVDPQMKSLLESEIQAAES